MASVTLEEGWFQPAADLATSVRVDLSSLREAAGRSPEVRNYAGGRRRLVTREDARQALQITATVVDRDDVDQLRAWANAGTLLLFRDPRGRAVYGALEGYQVTEYEGADEGYAAVSVTVQGTTDTPEV